MTSAHRGLLLYCEDIPVGTALIASLCVSLGVTLVLLRLASEKTRLAKEKATDDAIGRAWVLDRVTKDLERIWTNPVTPFVLISPPDLAVLDSRTPHRPAPDAVTLTFALTINDNPIGLATAHAPFLHELEHRMERKLGRQVFLSLQLYKAGSWASLVGEREDADVQRMSYLTYVRLREMAPGTTPLAQERSSAEVVIFARADAKNTSQTFATAKTLVRR